MSSKDMVLPNWREAVRHLELLTGVPDPRVCFQVFSDTGKGGQGAHRHGRLSSKVIRDWLLSAAKRGCGVYIVINRTDAKAGAARTSRITWRALSTSTRLRCRLNGTPAGLSDREQRRKAPRLLAPRAWHRSRHLGGYAKAPGGLLQGHPKVCDAPRVSLAGFDHQKGKSFRVRIIDERLAFGDLYTLDLVRAGLPGGAASTPAKATSSTPAPDVKLDTDAAVKSARSFLANAEQGEAGERNNTAYQHACKLTRQSRASWPRKCCSIGMTSNPTRCLRAR